MTRSPRSLLLGALLALLFLPVDAAAQIAAPAAEDTLTVQKNGSWVFLPNLFYTPETRIAGGLVLGRFFKMPGSTPTDRSSSLLGVFVYTQNNQVIAQLIPDLYLRGDTYRLQGQVQYIHFPNTFYGIGNDTPDDTEEDFTARTFNLAGEALVRIAPGFFIGPSLTFASQDLVETEDGRLLETGTLPGSTGGQVAALGFQAVHDTRNNAVYASRGHYYRLGASFAHRTWGSDYDFGAYSLDLRQFVPLPKSHVLGLQGFMAYNPGTVPFTVLPQLGGANLMRGFYEGRYRDHALVVMQAEYRMPLWKRFGLAGFVGVGQVAEKPTAFAPDDLYVAGGGGIRFALNKQEKMNIRIDYGVGPGTSGLYITLGEAF